MNVAFLPRLIVGIILTGCLFLAGFLLVVLAFYNHPSPTDDYCFTDTVIKFGFWQAQVFYYNGWTGRFFHNFIVHTNPMVWGWIDGYHVFPILVLGLLWSSFYVLARQLTRHILSPVDQLVMASGGTFLTITSLATIAEFFYWYTGLACYSLSCIFLILLLGVFIIHDRHKFQFSTPLFIAEAFLVMGIIGSSETSMVMAMSLLAMLLLCMVLYRRKIPVSFISLLVWAVICCFFLLQAPGNAVRMSGNPQNQNLVFSVVETLKYSLGYFPKLLVKTPILPLSLLFLPLAFRLTEGRSVVRPYFFVHPLLALLYFGSTLFALTFLHFWAVGIPPVARLMNAVNIVFILGWFYNLIIWVRVFRQRIGDVSLLTDYNWPLVAVAGLGLLFTTYANSNLKMMYSDWRSGRAAQYDLAMKARYQQMAASPADTVVLAPLAAFPASLVLEDITPNPQHLWNKCWASYYHKNGVRLGEVNAQAVGDSTTQLQTK
ncbi:DUF6056 family protein [Tellurirhabdus bombi]|uniref:DUF6056 family protein n=1 Tax=Tellurirhabdus bombi TaxID=2907205 RepID=UPI001F2CCD0B|nr:DUF6056 family protein [Tellurirhabdus bombi]